MNSESLILIVDDLLRNLQLLGRILREKSYQVAAVSSGQDALDFMEERKPDLILLDVMMPGLDGFEICRRLKLSAETKEIPVIFISALGDVDNKLKGFEVGGVDYITKPFQKLEVLARVENHLQLNRARQEIKRSEEKFRNYINSAPDAIFVFDKEGNYLEVNEAACELTGYSQAELLQMNIEQLKVEKETAKINKDFQSLLKKGELQKELIVKRKDGAIYYTLLNAVQLDENRYIGFKKNITDRKFAEIVLKESEEKFRQIAENIKEVFFITSADLDEILYVSPAYESIWGGNLAELYQEPLSWIENIASKDKKRVLTKLKKSYEEESEFAETYRIYRADNSRRWIDMKAFPVYDEAGELYRYAGLAEDVTEKKELQDELKHRIELESLIIDFSKSFINLKMAEISNQIRESLKRIASFINVEYSYIYLFSKDKINIIKSYTWQTENYKIENNMENMIRRGEVQSLMDFSWFMGELKAGRVIDINEIAEIPEEANCERKLFAQQKLKSILMIPLIYNNKLLGVLGFDSILEQKWWPKEIISLFEVIGDILINAIERKRREKKLKDYYLEVKEQNLILEELYTNLDQEFEKGSKLHSQFLPDQLPEIEGLSFGAYYKPAAKLGGDFYDVIEIADQLIVYLADVSGHGLDGSMLNIFLRESINSYLLYEYKHNQPFSPAKMIKFITNKYREEGFPGDYFICLLLGVLDLKSMELSFSNAGFQIQPLLVKEDGEINPVLCEGLPISTAIEEQSYKEAAAYLYQEQRIKLEKNNTLFMSTDGLIEELVEQEHYGEERLKRALSRCSKLTPKLAIECVNQDFKEFSGRFEGQDDITFFILKRE